MQRVCSTRSNVSTPLGMGRAPDPLHSHASLDWQSLLSPLIKREKGAEQWSGTLVPSLFPHNSSPSLLDKHLLSTIAWEELFSTSPGVAWSLLMCAQRCRILSSLKNFREADGLCLSSQHPGHQGVNPSLRMGLVFSLRLPVVLTPTQKPLKPSGHLVWEREEHFFPSHLMILVTSQGFHGDKTKKPGGFGESSQTNPPLRVFSPTLGLPWGV